MQASRSEGSVVASLSELRAIERQRITDERDARQRAAAAEIARVAGDVARAEAEANARRAAAEAARADELAAAAARERARELAIAQAEIAARVRAEAELAATTLAHEMAVRREAASRQRPIALIAISALLAVAGVILAIVLVHRSDEAAERTAAADAALAQVQQFHAQTTDAKQHISEIQRELDARRAEVERLERIVHSLASPPSAPTAPSPSHPHPRPPVTPGAPPATVPSSIAIDPACTGTALGCLPHAR